MKKCTIIGLSTLILASSAMAAITNTVSFGPGGDSNWDTDVATNSGVSPIEYSVSFGVPDVYTNTVISNLSFTVTFTETNGIPVYTAANWIYPSIDGAVDDRRLNSNEVLRLTTSYSDPDGKLMAIRLSGIGTTWNTQPYETMVFSDGVNSTNITDSANDTIFDYEGLGLDLLSTNNVDTWELLVGVDDAIGGGTNFTEAGMGAFIMEYIADVNLIPEYTPLSNVFFDFVDNGGTGEFDNQQVGATMTRSNSWGSAVTITTIEIIGLDGTSATNGTNNKTNIQSGNAMGINSANFNNTQVPFDARDFNPNEAWVVTFDTDVYMERIDLQSTATNTEMTISSPAFSNIVLYGLGGINTNGTWNLSDTYVPAGTTVMFEMTSTTNIADTSLRIDDLTLQVVADAESYDAWIQDESLTAEVNDGYGDDPDMDDMDNLLEFALGANPLTNDAAAFLPGYDQTADGGTNWLNYVYRRRIKYNYSGLDYTVGSTTDLVASPATNATEEAGSVALDDDIESVTNRVSTDVEAQQFMQLNVTID